MITSHPKKRNEIVVFIEIASEPEKGLS